MMQLETNILGVFALKNGKIILKETFGKDIPKIAGKIRAISDGVVEEEKKVLKELSDTGNKKIAVSNPLRFKSLKTGVEFLQAKPANLFEISRTLGMQDEEVRKILRQVNTEISRRKLKEIERDQLVIQAVKSLDEIQDAANLLNERLREWYSLHFPELDHLVEGNEAFTKIVATTGNRSGLNEKNLLLDPKHNKNVLESLKTTLGVDFTKEDLEAIGKLARPTLALYDSKSEIEKYIEGEMREIAPNLTELAGAQLGARLMAIAGSLKRLAVLPAGTIQVLGAEDAFFRFLQTGKRPPKHGVIFQYPDIRSAKKNIRGKLARTLAAKIAIAARADAYGKNFIAPKLLKDYKKRFKDLSK
ncbi:MAG TPA: C/D box methylation guide ribonucleoprotein complex aNOP56 subunit [Candidatus Altiarchaeales archaeon]|nr:C/D box methylation guide ribonucleoprotein complex aNOP56 subunit [Candidatus Altiarchaeales archaeon]